MTTIQRAIRPRPPPGWQSKAPHPSLIDWARRTTFNFRLTRNAMPVSTWLTAFPPARPPTLAMCLSRGRGRYSGVSKSRLSLDRNRLMGYFRVSAADRRFCRQGVPVDRADSCPVRGTIHGTGFRHPAGMTVQPQVQRCTSRRSTPDIDPMIPSNPACRVRKSHEIWCCPRPNRRDAWPGRGTRTSGWGSGDSWRRSALG